MIFTKFHEKKRLWIQTFGIVCARAHLSPIYLFISFSIKRKLLILLMFTIEVHFYILKMH